MKTVQIGLVQRQLIGKDLDGELLIFAFLIGQVDRAHAAFAEPAQETIVADGSQMVARRCGGNGEHTVNRELFLNFRRERLPFRFFRCDGRVRELSPLQVDSKLLSLARVENFLGHQRIEEISGLALLARLEDELNQLNETRPARRRVPRSGSAWTLSSLGRRSRQQKTLGASHQNSRQARQY